MDCLGLLTSPEADSAARQGQSVSAWQAKGQLHALAGRADLRDGCTVPYRRPPGGRTARTPLSGAWHGRVRLRRGPLTGVRTVGLATLSTGWHSEGVGERARPGFPTEFNGKSPRGTVARGRRGSQFMQRTRGKDERWASPEVVDRVSAGSGFDPREAHFLAGQPAGSASPPNIHPRITFRIAELLQDAAAPVRATFRPNRPTGGESTTTDESRARRLAHSRRGARADGPCLCGPSPRRPY